MRIQSILALLLVGTALLAGCTSSPAKAPQPSEGVPDGVVAHLNTTLPSGDGAYAFLDGWITAHPFRTAGATQSFMDTARDDLATELTKDGLRVVRQAYDGTQGVNILGFQNGTTHPEQWVVLSAHYDIVQETVYGAWDDGAGTAALLELAAKLSKDHYPYTVVYAFFDEEENGLVGSGAFVKEYADQLGVDILANVNMDPPGLNWPCGDALGAFPVRIIVGPAGDDSPRLGWLNRALAFGLNATLVPADLRDYAPGIPIATVAGTGVTGGSDHESFWGAKVAAAFLGSAPTTDVGPASALTYGLHTPADTVQQMEARCATGTGTLADGLGTIVVSIAHALDYMAVNAAPSA